VYSEAVAGMHINAKQTVQNNGQSFSVGLAVHHVPGREFDDPPPLDHQFDRFSRD
jgi:hypothetical protein